MLCFTALAMDNWVILHYSHLVVQMVLWGLLTANFTHMLVVVW